MRARLEVIEIFSAVPNDESGARRLLIVNEARTHAYGAWEGTNTRGRLEFCLPDADAVEVQEQVDSVFADLSDDGDR